MELKSVADYLQSKGLGTMGVDIFVGQMPFECTRGVLFLDYYAGTKIDHELPGYRDTGFRFVVRSPEYDDGKTLANAVSEVFTIHRDTPMDGLLMRRALPVNDPLPYPRSKGSAVWEFEVDVDCVYIKQ